MRFAIAAFIILVNSHHHSTGLYVAAFFLCLWSIKSDTEDIKKAIKEKQ